MGIASTHLRLLLPLVLAAGTASGCSTVTEVAGIPHQGHQPGGGYVLLASEQSLDCRSLNDEIERGLKDMKQAHARFDAERGELPRTVVRAFSRAFGGENDGLKSAEKYRQSEVRVRALNQQLGAKGCHTVDVDTRIAEINSGVIDASATPMQASATPASETGSLQSDIEALTAPTIRGVGTR